MRGARAGLVAVPLLLAGFASGAAASPPNRPAAPPPDRPAAPPPSGPMVRIGDHRSYGRVVFDFPGPAGAAMTQQGEAVVLRFDAPGTPVMPRRLPRNVRAMVVADGRATLTLAPGSRAHEMILGDHVVLDALDPVRGRVAAAPPPMRAAPPGMEPDTRRDAAAPAPAPRTAPAGPVAIAAAHPAGVPSPPAMRPAAPAATPAATPAAAAPPSTVAETTAPTAIAPAAASADATAPAAQGDPTAIVVPFGASVGAAAFRVGGDGLVVFDAARPIDLSAVQDDAAFARASVRVYPAATVLRVPLGRDEALHLALGEYGWTVSVVPAPPRVRPLRPRANPAGLLLPARAPGRVVVIADPRTGQDLLVGTLRAEGEALAVARRTPGFTLRATWQGVVVAPIADRLSLTALKDGFELAGTGAGLHLSAALPAVADAAAAAHLTRSFDLPRLPRAALLRQLQACTLAAAEAAPLARTAPRLDCARTLLALGMGAEAEALLHLARAQDAALARDRGVAALQAVAALMAGRPDDAAALDDPRLPMTDEIAFWRAVRIAERRPGAPQAATAFAATAPLALAYPAALRRTLLPLAAETMALGGEPDAAASLLGARPADDPRLAYAHGLLLARAGDDAGALRIFDALARSRDQMLAARGATRAVLLRAKAGQLAPAAAADALGPLLVEWPSARGKLHVRLAMARLRQAAGEWPAAFAALRRADALYPADRARIRGRIAAAFAALLRPGVAEAMPPLAFAALAEDNAALLPPGAASGRLPRLLADRLIALDLGGRAAPIIARLMAAAHGPARAGLGARLAALRLQTHDAAGALAALDASRSDGLAPALTERRRLLRARGLAERGDRDAAVALLAGMDSTAGDDLRAHLLVQAKDWPAAEAALRSVVARTVPVHGPLATDQRSTLLRLASAAAQAGDATELAELHDETARMGDGRLGRLFRLLTAGPVQTASDLPRSAAEIALARAVPADLAAIGSH